MSKKVLQDLEEIKSLLEAERIEDAWILASEPLHEALYKAQSFEFLDLMSVNERLCLSFDYIKKQVNQGGFIQLLQNGYASLLVSTIEDLQQLQIAREMVAILDDALKIYVLNIGILSKEVGVEEFAKLYTEFTEFEGLENRFNILNLETEGAILGSLLK